MSNQVFPTLRPSWPVNRTPMFKTHTVEAASGVMAALAYQKYPIYEWELTYQLLDDTLSTSELRALAGFYNAVRGQFDTFLYTDPNYNTVTQERFGTGDGRTLAFQIIATYQNAGGPGLAEKIQNFNGVPTLYDNGTPILNTAYSLGPTGIVTFNSPPAVGHALTWSGSFFYRCRFSADKQNFTEFMNRWFSVKGIKFRSVYL